MVEGEKSLREGTKLLTQSMPGIRFGSGLTAVVGTWRLAKGPRGGLGLSPGVSSNRGAADQRGRQAWGLALGAAIAWECFSFGRLLGAVGGLGGGAGAGAPWPTQGVLLKLYSS